MGRAIQQLSKIVRLHEQEFKLACSGMLGDFMLWLWDRYKKVLLGAIWNAHRLFQGGSQRETSTRFS